jgi:mono/diheme cytochrome c family protein
MSLRTLAVWFALLSAAGAAAGCSRHGARQAASPPAVSVPGADFGRGKAVYEAQCAACHGRRGIGGPVGPSLQNENVRRPYRSVYALVRDPAPPMPKLYPARLSAADLRDVSAYVESL